MNKIALQINDSTIMEQLLQDEEFQIKIKDAICEGIAKKAIKLVNISPDIQSVAAKVTDTVREQVEELYFTKDNWGRMVLKNSRVNDIKKAAQETIDQEIKNYIYDEVQKAVKQYNEEIKKEVEMYKNWIHDWMEKYDVEYRFKHEVQEYIKKKFEK